jgi:hypothetical protein
MKSDTWYKIRIEEPPVDAFGSIEQRKEACISEHLACVLVIGAELITAMLTDRQTTLLRIPHYKLPSSFSSYLAAQLWQPF